MTDYSDLIARLRAMQSIRRDSTPLSAALRACHEAADALEAQAREIERLKRLAVNWDGDLTFHESRLAAAERERDKAVATLAGMTTEADAWRANARDSGEEARTYKARLDEAVALLRHVESTCGCAGVDIDAIVAFLAKIKEGK